MGSHHSHGAGGDDFRIGRRALTWLLAVLVPLLAATVAGLVMLWPSGTPTVARQVSAQGEEAEDAYPATVTAASATQCAGTSSDRQADGTIPETTTCASVTATVGSGPDQGASVTVQVPAQVYRAGIGPGDSIQVARYPAETLDGSTAAGADPGALADGTVYAWIDFSRGFPLTVLAIGFAVLVVAVGRLRGLAAMIGLGLSYLAVLKFMLPALRLGENPVLVALAGSIAVMTVVLYLAHGVSAKTTAALLGTVSGLALTALLADWASTAGHLNGLSSEENYTLAQLTGSSDLSGVILCGIIVAGLGVLNDVTITQASAVWEVRAHAPELGFRQLFVSGMRVGRDHLASTVYTIAFAYAGAALPTLILIDLYHQPLTRVLTGGQIAEEIVRTLVGAIGLILAIPLTTAVAAAVVASSPRAELLEDAGGRLGWMTSGSGGGDDRTAPDEFQPGLLRRDRSRRRG
ncbi:YibE/F family protein [Kineosporia sp. J2-2]|uniref:YibE/F family protein n=1 Tax=Kineosporia corallincola TaxID=2835133 RepID=A0ABS5TD67_9ACTN|nr:YibE/F family protein [Kineosporia corallincola]MBT0769027.1 YibE/F family protein [Kineosporia corallincola]